MAEPLTKGSFQKRLFENIKDKTGTCNVIVVPVVLLRFCRNLETAVMLSHLSYWADRSGNREGYVWKSYREWAEETGLNRYQVEKATVWLTTMGLLQVKKKMAQGHPTLHYKLDQEAVIAAIGKFPQINLTKLANGYDESRKSITETLTETSSKTLRSDKGIPQKPVERALPLKAFLKKAKAGDIPIDGEAIEAVTYFFEAYKRNRNEAHPPLKFRQWETVFDSILSYDNDLHSRDLTASCLEAMIERYFKTSFKNCDYRIMHFNTNGIKSNRLYEECY